MHTLRAVLSAFVLGSLGGSVPLSAAESSIPVAVVSPIRRDVTRWLQLPANVEADAEVVFSARVSGFLKDFHSEVGDRVKPGQVIGQLDAPELEQDVKLAAAHVLETQSEYQKALAQAEREKARGEELDAQEAIVKAELAKSKVEAALANNLSDRTEKLFSKDAATEQERDVQKFTAQGKEAATLVAERKLDELKAARNIWQRELAAAEAEAEAVKSKIQVSEATLTRAKVWQAYTELKVPQIGTHAGSEAIITRRYVAAGDLISGGMASKTGGQPLVALQVVDPVRIIADVPETDAVGLEAGTLVRVRLPGIKTEPQEYKISRTSNSLSSQSRTMRIEIDVPNPKNEIRPGGMASVELAAEVHKRVMAIPASCVVTEKHDTSVFVVDGNKAKKMAVKLGLKSASWVELLDSSLSENVMLIKEIGGALEDGTTVQTKPAQ